jgi:hypothetical protein
MGATSFFMGTPVLGGGLSVEDAGELGCMQSASIGSSEGGEILYRGQRCVSGELTCSSSFPSPMSQDTRSKTSRLSFEVEWATAPCITNQVAQGLQTTRKQ